MRTSSTILSVAAIALATTACKNDNSLAAVVPKPDGDLVTVQGRVCDPDRGTWLEGATAYMHLFTDDGVHYDTKMDETDEGGYFQLVDIPYGDLQPIFVQYGNAVIDQYTVEAPEGLTYITLPDPDCGGGDAAFAVVSGDYDDFAVTLQELGYGSFDVVNGQTGDELVQFLGNAEGLANYDAIFFGGGHLEEDVIYDTNGSDVDGQVAEIQATLRAYVENGGHLVATDWSYDLIEVLWPDRIAFLGDDLVADDAQRGETGTVTAAITNDDLLASAGVTEVNISYDLIEWPLIEDVSPDTNVYLRGTVTFREGQDTQALRDKPLLVGFSVGAGTVWFSTFRFGPNLETSGKSAVRFLMESL